MPISKLPLHSSEKILLSSKEHLLPLKDRYIHTSFIDLLEKYSPSPNETQLKDFLIEKFIQERWKITNQHTISNKKWLKKVNFWNVNYLPIYDYSFHIIFKNENDGILTFFYSPDNYNQYEKVYHSFKEIEEAINDLADHKWEFQLIIQKWNKINKPSPANNTKYKLTEILAA